eukprot:6201066-Pleurochrysis_carterae.AAC.1
MDLAHPVSLSRSGSSVELCLVALRTHCPAAQCVLSYLHRHRDVGLTFSASRMPLHWYSDSDWAVQHPTSGCVFKFGNAGVSWLSKKQATVAPSFCEEEVVADPKQQRKQFISVTF